jgi:hypothetical protein
MTKDANATRTAFTRMPEGWKEPDTKRAQGEIEKKLRDSSTTQNAVFIVLRAI